MASVNKVHLLGNLGRDPEVRYAPSGAAIANVTIATSRSWKDKTSGEKQEETEWHRLVFYDRLAEVVGQYAKKGKPIYVEGRLKTRKWTDKDGVDKYTTEIVVEQLQLLGGRDDGDARPSGRPSTGSAYADAKASNAPQQPKAGTGTGFDEMDDDIPFATSSMSFDMQSKLDRRISRRMA